MKSKYSQQQQLPFLTHHYPTLSNGVTIPSHRSCRPTTTSFRGSCRPPWTSTAWPSVASRDWLLSTRRPAALLTLWVPGDEAQFWSCILSFLVCVYFFSVFDFLFQTLTILSCRCVFIKSFSLPPFLSFYYTHFFFGLCTLFPRFSSHPTLMLGLLFKIFHPSSISHFVFSFLTILSFFPFFRQLLFLTAS